jgi:hypothetical protein
MMHASKGGSMALGGSHAAARSERRYAVRLLAGPDPATDLADGFEDFLDATDFAVEWLDREDPAREQTRRLVILERTGENSREVWRYPAERRTEAQGLLDVFGFDPTTWRAGVQYEHATDSSR